jgi:hypothetical protein
MNRAEEALHYLELTMKIDPNYRNVKTLIEKTFSKVKSG